jgi:hypothetical protein
MRERPILFSAPMVRAILDGRKTQTRRLVKPRRAHEVAYKANDGHVYSIPEGEVGEHEPCGDPRPLPCPYGAPGDRLWVRETIRRGPVLQDGLIGRRDTATYAADGAPTPLDTWPWQRPVLPGIHCPRGLSRITLEVTGVRVERLQDISEDDARAEGVTPTICLPGDVVAYGPAFAHLWDSINRTRAPWDSNPWVWVIEFHAREGRPMSGGGTVNAGGGE